jgi:Protein of unknown function (DUF1217)
MSASLSYLPSLLSSLSGATDPLLDAIYGGSGTGQTAQSALQALTNAEQNQTQEVNATAAQPSVERAVATFTAAVKSATDVNQLLSNQSVMDVLLTANGLGDQTNYTALAKAALTSDVNDPNSLVNQLSDTRWKTLASTYNFATQGLSAIQTPQAIAAIGKAYAQTVWEQNEDAATPGLANALTFKATASSATSVDQILGNLTLRTVVTTTLGIPQEIAFQSTEAQEKAITDRLDITQLQDPKFVASFTQRYLIANAQNNSSTSSSTPDITTLAVQAGGILV